MLHYAEHDPARVAAVTRRLDRYRRRLGRLRLSDRVVAARAGKARVSRGRIVVSLVTGAPVAIYGWLNHLVPYNVPRLAVRIFSPEAPDVSTIKLASGTIAFLACYTGQIALAARLGPRFALGYALSLPISGLFALHYAHRLEIARSELSVLARFAGRRRGKILAVLAAERDAIYRELETARVQWRALAPSR
ncbi:MAG: hypothetical protein U0166_01820 [Acidobacteriota bacterium]